MLVEPRARRPKLWLCPRRRLLKSCPASPCSGAARSPYAGTTLAAIEDMIASETALSCHCQR